MQREPLVSGRYQLVVFKKSRWMREHKQQVQLGGYRGSLAVSKQKMVVA